MADRRRPSNNSRYSRSHRSASSSNTEKRTKKTNRPKRGGGFLVVLALITIAVVSAMLALDAIKPSEVFAPEESSEVVIDSSIEPLLFETDLRMCVYPTPPKGLFAATKDGVKFYDDHFIELQSATFNMNEPILVGAGSYVGVWEYNMRTAYVFSDEGSFRAITSDSPIINMTVGATGLAAIITRPDSGYRLSISDSEGNLIGEGVFSKPNVYPTGAVISDDGETLAVSFLDVIGARMNSSVSYARLSKGASLEYTNNVFAANPRNPDEIVAAMKFINNGDTLIIITDKRIRRVDMSDPSAEKWSVAFDNEITSVAYDHDIGIVVGLGKATSVSGVKAGTLQYRSSVTGEVLWETLVSERQDINALSADNGVIVGVSGTFTAFSRGGDRLWDWQMPSEGASVYFFGSNDTALCVNDTSINLVNSVEFSENSINTQ